jgi:hypothetical protein
MTAGSISLRTGEQVHVFRVCEVTPVLLVVVAMVVVVLVVMLVTILREGLIMMMLIMMTRAISTATIRLVKKRPGSY